MVKLTQEERKKAAEERRRKNLAEIERKKEEKEAERNKKRKLSIKDRLELAQSRARRAGLPADEMPISQRGKITTQEQLATEAQQDIQRGLIEQVKEDPSQFGLLKPGEQPAPVEGVEVTEQPQEFTIDPETGEKVPLLSGQVSSAEGLVTDIALLAAGGGGIKLGWKVGGKIFGSSKGAMQAGTAAKNTAAVKPLATKIRDYAIGGFAILATVSKAFDFFTRKIDEQQQAVNTLGQMATTIGGDSTEATGDWRKGVQELQFIKNEVLRLESAIKSGTIASASLKYDGRIYDINADMADQLATIDEQIRIIQSFVVTNSFPELDELQIQNILRQLEEEGFVEPVDLTTSRRPTNE